MTPTSYATHTTYYYQGCRAKKSHHFSGAAAFVLIRRRLFDVAKVPNLLAYTTSTVHAQEVPNPTKIFLGGGEEEPT